MGTTAKDEKKDEKKPKAPGGGGGGGGGKKDKREKKQRGPHGGAKLPIPPARLRDFYNQTVRPKLAAQFGFKNPHEIPGLSKIVVNVGLGEAIKQARLLDGIVDELATITGQAPVRKKAKKSIANFGLRQGQEIGATVTLRNARMWEFLDRLVAVAIPRIRDFRGLSTRSFDGRGNYSLGLKEQMIFPEINYDDIEMIHGMDITFVTTATRDDHGLALLKELGMPFRMTEDKKR